MEINEVKEWAEKSTLMLVNGTVCRTYVNWEEPVDEDENRLVMSLTPINNGYEEFDLYEGDMYEFEFRGNCVQYGSLMLVRLIPERDETIRFD
jgi:hypothetical protein